MIDALADSYRHCQQLARRTAGNFYYSFLTLPRDRFRAMCVLYAFMRVTDDIGDDDRPTADRVRDLAAWREALAHVCDGKSSDHPVLPAVADILRTYHIPREYLDEVITGVEADLGAVSFETFAQLSDYCYHVAGAVGLACIHIWGFHDERAKAAAVDCGTAFQLTNILRDLGEDAARGRVYLPSEDLLRFGYTLDDITRQCRDERFLALMQFETARAREYYEKARALFDYLDPPGKPILDTMIGIYGGLLNEIERRHFDVFTRRVELSRWNKCSIALGSLVRSKLRRSGSA